MKKAASAASADEAAAEKISPEAASETSTPSGTEDATPIAEVVAPVAQIEVVEEIPVVVESGGGESKPAPKEKENKPAAESNEQTSTEEGEERNEGRGRRNRNRRGGPRDRDDSGPKRPPIDKEEAATKAWEIYQGVLEEEGVSLVDPRRAREVARRCLELATIFCEERNRYLDR